MTAKTSRPKVTNFAVNRQAQHLYNLLEKFEAGIELTGTEVKSVRQGKANLKDGYAAVKGTEVWLMRCHISPYGSAGYVTHDALRDRRLLLHRREIEKIAARTQERGLTLIPLRLFLKNNFIKCELALAKGKKVYDHREAARERTIRRETEQAIWEHRRRHS